MTLLPLFDLAVAARHSMGQDPLRAIPDAAGAIDTVRITRAYGRFGNNVYQLLNAMVVARYGGFRRLVVPPLALLLRFDPFTLDGVMIECDDRAPLDGCLAGSFFVPYGCEPAALRCGAADWAPLFRNLADRLYGGLLDATPERPGIVLHFRSGDVFRFGRAPAAYVQPPAAYYLKALAHARSEGCGGIVDLVYEDRGNPAIAAVEADLDVRSIPYRSTCGGDPAEDLSRLLTASTIVASASTFVEAAALLSRRLKRYYSFREHGSQGEFKPFAQACIEPILRRRDIRCVLIDDVSRTYVNKWQWTAAADQCRAVATFDAAHLRLFECG